MAFSLGGPIIQGLMALFTMQEQAKQQGQYTEDIDKQIDQALATARRMGPETLGAYDKSSKKALQALLRGGAQQNSAAKSMIYQTKLNRNQFLGDYEQRGNALMGGYQQGLGDLLGSYDDRYSFAENELKGYGDQMQADIDEGYANKQGELTQKGIGTGLYSSTVQDASNLAVERERSGEQRRLGEDLTRNRINVLGGIMGERSGAQERGLQYGTSQQAGLDSAQAAYDAAMRGDVLNARRYLMESDAAHQGNLANYWGTDANNRSNLVGSGIGSYLNTLMGINRMPPPSMMGLMQQFGANSVQPPSAPSFWESAGPGAVQGGIGAAGMLGAATIIAAGICIGEDSLLITLDGEKPLKDIRVGDQILNAAGEWREVIAKHLGQFKGDWGAKFGRLCIDDRSIVISLDHVVDGREAKDWIGEPNVKWEPVKSMKAGDLLLDDGSEYSANDFAITSLIGRSDVALLRQLEPENQC